MKAGTLTLDGTLASIVTVTGGTFAGTGTVNQLSATAGTIAPGNSPGVLATKQLTLDSSSTLSIEVNGGTSDEGLPLVVERTMRWDQTGYGAHTEKAADGTALHWYFAEGSQGYFSTYLLLVNPQDAPNVATVQYLREGAPPIERTYDIAARSRYTVDAGADPDLVNTSFGMHVTFASPGAAERAMYFGTDPLWKGGHESAGVTAPSQTWFLAEDESFGALIVSEGPIAVERAMYANANGQVWGAGTNATATRLP